MVQFGINGDPRVIGALARGADPRRSGQAEQQARHDHFATAGPNSRTTQVFINFGDNSQLDGMGFAPFGQVMSGMNVVDRINAEYGEGAPRGRGPEQGKLQTEGNAYLAKGFPRMDYVKKATIVR